MRLPISLLFIILLVPLDAISGDLKISIDGLRNTKGQILIGVYNKEKKFPQKGFEFAGIVVKLTQAKSAAIFRNLPGGVYAAAVIHDENMDGELNKNLFGTPSEGYGFSNNAEGFLGPPDFDEAAFSMKAVDKTILIQMKY